MYEQVRTEFASELQTLDDVQLATRVPATPACDVHDVVAHLVGLAADLNAQRFPADDDGGSAWNDAQLVTHVLDVAEALEVPIEVGAASIDMALEHYTAFVADRLAETGRTMPRAVLDLSPIERLRLLSARRALVSVSGAHELAGVYDGSGYTFPEA